MNLCPKCNSIMQRRGHPQDWKPRPDQPYYYAWWYVCTKCRRVQHYESAKVHLARAAGSVPVPKKVKIKKKKQRKLTIRPYKEPGAYSKSFWTRQKFGPASLPKYIKPPE